MKKRFIERVLVLMLSMAVLLSSTGAYSAFAVSKNGFMSFSAIKSSSSAAKNEQETTTPESDSVEPNLVSDGGTVEAVKLNGKGTAENPYIVSNADELFAMQSVANDSTSGDKYFVLTKDIDLSGVSYSEMNDNSVLPGTIVSVDKAVCNAAPDEAKFILEGNNHKIFGLNITNNGSSAVGIFGYISPKSVIKNVVFEDISVNVSYSGSVSSSVIAVCNNGEISGCTVKNVALNISASANGGVSSKTVGKLKIKNSTGLIGRNNGKICDMDISKVTVDISAGKDTIAVVSGMNSGTISNITVNKSSVKAVKSDNIGGVAGKNSGKIESATVNGIKIKVDKKAVCGGIVGENSGIIDSCVVSGSVTGSSYSGGIAGYAVSESKSTVKNCYSLAGVSANNETGAVIAAGKSVTSGNVWSSDISGRIMAYENGSVDGKFNRENKLIVVRNGQSEILSKASLSGSFAGLTYSLDTSKDIAFDGEGITFSEDENSIVITADSADKTGKITYTSKVSVQAGCNGLSEIDVKFNTVVLTVPEGTAGDGLTEASALEIKNSAELSMIKSAPFANYILSKDVTMSESWDSSISFTGTLNGNGNTIKARKNLFKFTNGKVYNLNVVLCASIKTAVFGNAYNAKFSKVKLSAQKSEDGFIGLKTDKSNTATFINTARGNITISNCFTSVPVNVNGSGLKNIAGFIAVLDTDNAVISSSGSLTSITVKDGCKISSSAAFIASADGNKNGKINDCYATLYSDDVKNILIASGDSSIKMTDSVFSSSSSKAVAAPKKFVNIEGKKWAFESGEFGFVSAEGSVVSIAIPVNVIKGASADDFKVMFDSEVLKVNSEKLTVKDNVLNIPVEAAKPGVTIKNSALVVTHKGTGLRAEISLSNGLEKDKDGNYIINCGADFLFINNDFDNFCDKSFILSGNIDMSGIDFSTIGGASGKFTGKLDGNGYTVKGLKINGTAKAGLFGTVDGAKIVNIYFEDAVVNASNDYAGVLAAQITGNTTIKAVNFKNCSVISTGNYAGIAAGETDGIKLYGISVENSSVKALNYAGFVVGKAENSEIKNISAKNVKASGENNIGLFGCTENSKLEKIAVNNGIVSGGKFVGGISGSAEESEISNVKVNGTTVSAAADVMASAPVAGGVCGFLSGKLNGAVVKSLEVKSSGSSAVAGGVAGITENAEISNAEVYGDVKVSAYVVGGIIGEAENNTSVYNSKSLAAVCGSDTQLRVVTGAGGVIGRVKADDFATVKISKVNVSGKITAVDSVGGIIGSVISEKADGVSVKDCVCAAEIVVTSDNGMKISGCIIGNVTELKSDALEKSVEGIVYSSYGSGLNAIGTADVKSGYYDADKAVKAVVPDLIKTRAENKISVSTGDIKKYGFVFDSDKGWQSESAKRIVVVDSSENQVKIKAVRSGNVGIAAEYKLSADKDIVIKVHFNVKSEIATTLKGEGTKSNPYVINNAFDLENVSYYSGENSCFVLNNDIKFSADAFKFSGDFYNEGCGFTPIGSKENPFNGKFDGNGHKISGLCVNSEDGALFGYASDAEIKNVTVEKATITGNNSAAAVVARLVDSEITNVFVTGCNVVATDVEGSASAVVAYAKNSKIENVNVESAEITACPAEFKEKNASAGAVCARVTDVTVNKVTVNGADVVSNGFAGGFIGYCDNAIISNSKTVAEIKGNIAGAVSADTAGKLTAENIVAGGTVYGHELAAGLSAKSDAPVVCKNVIISAKVKGEGVSAVVTAKADESIFTDSADSEVVLENIVYSSYQNNLKPFGDKKINMFQSADYVGNVYDANVAEVKEGNSLVIGKDKTDVFGSIKSEFDFSKFVCENIYSVPEGLVKYNKADNTVTAAGTNVDGAQLVIRFDNGIEIAVPMVSVVGLTGNGSDVSPFVVNSEDTLKLLKVYPESNFKMSGDVELKNVWTPVENFSGKFDGNGYTISGLNIKADNAGLFNTVSGKAVIKNISFTDAVIEGKASAGVLAANVSEDAQISGVSIGASSVKADEYAGAVAGNIQSTNSAITLCSVTSCEISADYAAGIVGMVSGKASVISCEVESSEIKGAFAAGAVAGLASAEKFEVLSCSTSADVTAENAGALIGIEEKNAVIDKCATNGLVAGKYSEGGVIGISDDTVSIKNTKSFASLSGKAKHSAALIGIFAVKPEDNEAFSDSFSSNTVSGEFDEFEPSVMKYQNFVPANREEIKPQLNGEGTKDNPYIISSAKDFAEIPDSSTAYFELADDIKLSASDYGVSYDKSGKAVYGVFNNGYKPIKNFAGVFDGKGHVISGLYIDSESDYVGLFANITASGVVKNLHVEILDKSEGLGFDSVTGRNYVGGIAGYCDSVNGIENCSVVGGSINGNNTVGGIAGGIAGSEIINSVAITEINGQNKSGGIAGTTTGECIIKNCAVLCDVNAAGGTLVGVNTGTLSLTDVFANGCSYGLGAVAVETNNGTINAQNVLVSGENDADKSSVLKAQKAENVYCDRTLLRAYDDNIKPMTTETLTSSKPDGLESWTQVKGRYPVPVMADSYANEKAALAAVPGEAKPVEKATGNVSVSYKLSNKSDDATLNNQVIGILMKSVNGKKIVTEDFFTNCSSDEVKLNKLLVTTGGFYIDSSLPQGFKIQVSAKDSYGNKLAVKDAGSEGLYVESGRADNVTLSIEIVNTDIPWGAYSLWESLAR